MFQQGPVVNKLMFVPLPKVAINGIHREAETVPSSRYEVVGIVAVGP